MNPCEMNIAIASLSNYLYTELCEDEFECLALFLNELSKSMFTMSVHEKLCSNHGKPPCKRKRKGCCSRPECVREPEPMADKAAADAEYEDYAEGEVLGNTLKGAAATAEAGESDG